MRTEFDYTMMSTYQTCQRRYYFRHQLGLTTPDEPMAPAFGSAIHKGLDSWYKDKDVGKAVEIFKADFKENIEQDDKRTHKLGEWILKNYDVTYKDQPYEVLATEQSFCLELPSGNKLIGRLDKVIKWSGLIWVLDHKTTSQLGASYGKMVEPNLQFDGYTWAVEKLGFGACYGVIVDAILVAKGLLDSSARNRLTPLARFDSYRSPARLKEFLETVSLIQNDITLSEKNHRWVPNFNACTYYGECPYRRVCLEDGQELRNKILETEYVLDIWDPRKEQA